MFSTAKTAHKNDIFLQMCAMCLPHILTHICVLISYLCIHQEVPHQPHGTFQRFLLTGQKGIFILIQGFWLADNEMGDLVIQGVQWFNSCGDTEGKQETGMKPCWRKTMSFFQFGMSVVCSGKVQLEIIDPHFLPWTLLRGSAKASCRHGDKTLRNLLVAGWLEMRFYWRTLPTQIIPGFYDYVSNLK